MRFKITVAETAYTDYFIEADDEDKAKAIINNQTLRAQTKEWAESGYNDDAEIISTKSIN